MWGNETIEAGDELLGGWTVTGVSTDQVAIASPGGLALSLARVGFWTAFAKLLDSYGVPHPAV